MRLFFGFLMFAMLCQAADHEWRQGEIVDSEIAHQTITPGAVTTGATTRIIHREITETHVIVRGVDFEYVAERQPSAYLQGRTGLVSGILLSLDHGCRFISGDKAAYAAEGKKLYVMDADGKQCKLNIVSQARVQAIVEEAVTPRTVTLQQTSPQKDFDFRHVYWGMGREEVVAAEGQPDKSDENELIFSEREVAGYDAKIAYRFCQGNLVGVDVVIPSRLREKDAKQVCAKWKATLDALYGKGGKDREKDGKRSSQVRTHWATTRTQVELVSRVDDRIAIVGVSFIGFTDTAHFNTQSHRDGF